MGPAERAPAAFEAMVREHFTDLYRKQCETIVAVWITERDEQGAVTEFDIQTEVWDA